MRNNQDRAYSLRTQVSLVGRAVVTGEAAAVQPARWSRVGQTWRAAVVDDRHGPLPAMLIALTALAGVVDAVSILALNRVFVAAMTGNLVFLGLAVAGASNFDVRSPSLALAGFVLGVLIGAQVCRHSGQHRGRALRNVIAVKTVLAATVTIAVTVAGDDLGVVLRDAVTVLLPVSMGTQLALIRYLKVPDLLTVVWTLTITGVLTERGHPGHDAALVRRLLAVFAFMAAATAGGLLVRLVSVAAALALGLAIIVGVGIASHLASGTIHPWSASL